MNETTMIMISSSMIGILVCFFIVIIVIKKNKSDNDDDDDDDELYNSSSASASKLLEWTNCHDNQICTGKYHGYNDILKNMRSEVRNTNNCVDGNHNCNYRDSPDFNWGIAFLTGAYSIGSHDDWCRNDIGPGWVDRKKCEIADCPGGVYRKVTCSRSNDQVIADFKAKLQAEKPT